MKKKSFALAILMALTLLFSGCGKSANSSASADSNYAPAESAPVASVETEATFDSTGALLDEGSDVYTDPNNKIIRSATLVIQTTEFDATVAGLGTLTKATGGYYETAEVESGGYYDTYSRRTAYYVVRVPKENFTAFGDGAGGIGHLYSIVEDSKDVGETYYDTEARLATLTTKRDRLLALLEEATVMEDIITLEDALADVLYEIDLHTATLRKYDSLINYSTFTITIQEVTKIVEEPKAEDSFGVKLRANLKDGFERFGEGVQDFVLWAANNLIGLVVFAAIVVAAVLLIRKRIRRGRETK